MSAMQGLNGKWEDAPPNSVVMEVFANGSVNYTTVDGFKISGCCSPVPYKTEGDKTILFRFEPETCAFTLCVANRPFDSPVNLSCSVTNVDGNTLEVQTGNGQRQMRYRKIG